MANSLRNNLEQIKELYLSGLSIRAVADIIGCSPSGVLKIVNKLGITRSNLDWQKDQVKMEQFKKYSSIKQKGIPRFEGRKYQLDMTAFDDMSDPFIAYLIGVILTDGHVADNRISLMVSNTDTEWMQSIADFFRVPLKIEKRGYPYFSINSIELVSKLRAIGINKDKTINPQPITIPSNEIDFLRGLIDGDGSVMIRDDGYPSVNFCGTSKFLVDWVCKKMREHGTKCSVSHVNSQKHNKNRKIPCKTDFYTTSCAGKAAKSFLTQIYYEDCFALQRKYDKALEARKWRL